MRYFVLILTLGIVSSSCSQNSKARRILFGELEADEIDVASRLPGRVRHILVVPGQAVKVGDVLVEFEDDLMTAKKKGALATIAAAESKQAIAQDAVRPEEKTQLKAAVGAAKEQMDFAKKTLDRTKALLKDGAVSQQNVDEVQFKYSSSLEAYNAAVARMQMANLGARAEEKAGASALVEQAKTLLAEVEAYEKDLKLTSPIDGEIVQIMNHEGELVPTGYPVVTILKLDQPWATLNVPEARLRELPKDSDVKLRIPALGDHEVGAKVSYVAPMANFATNTVTQDRGSFDLKTFEIRLTISDKIEGARPGMTVAVETAGKK